ncbi:hypothetical protein EYR38_004413 [Pleurotus pulmonarius]|nr:hypothetical protein EYR38_004413 [Pleurotus pulmonarius]
MDLRFSHGTNIYVVRPCCNEDASDLVAIGGEHSVQVLRLETIASFHIGSRITALAWASNAISPGAGDDWSIQLVAASFDFRLHHLTKTPSNAENIYSFAGGISGHHGKINDMTFCGGHGEDSSRYVATVSDDRMLMIWDLYPPTELPSRPGSMDRDGSPTPPPRAQPTAYVIPFSHPLVSVCSHPLTSKELVVADCRGSIFLTDWRSENDEKDRDSWRHSSIMELTEPSLLADASAGISVQWSGSAGWRRDAMDIIGAAYGPKFHIWDLATLQGGKPRVSGTTFPEGTHRFRWCHTYPEYFAVSSQSPLKGAVIHMHNINYVHAQPTVLSVLPRPHFVRDFDFLAAPGIPRLVVAVGTELAIFPIGVDS